MTNNAVSVISAVLTDNTSNIDLDGTYTIANIADRKITLVNPVSINPNWNRLGELTAQQQDAEQRLEQLVERWAYLTELAEASGVF